MIHSFWQCQAPRQNEHVPKFYPFHILLLSFLGIRQETEFNAELNIKMISNEKKEKTNFFEVKEDGMNLTN